jgi:serine phosphatase RsbU (regulator of sigma subunit)
MTRRWPLKFGLSLKLLLIGELVLLVAVLALFIPWRREMRAQVIRDLQNELRSIAVTAALQLDGDELKTIRTAADADKPQFAKLRKALNRARVANRLDIEHIYTFYRDGDTVRFGVMTHPRPFVGDPYQLRPEMRAAFDRGMSSVTDLYADQNGEYISAYAPIFDSNQQVVGILDVDKPAADYFRVYREVQRTTLIAAGSVLLMSSLLGWLVLNRVVIRPMRAVRAGMLALGRQDFTHRVHLHTHDEFEELGQTLNNISEQLNVARSVQMSFMPKDLPRQAGYRIAAATEPCEATAGDYFDAFAMDDERVAVLVADVTGHGLGPSLLMSACRSALHALVMADLSPAQVIARLDALLAQDLTEGRFITMIFGILDSGGTFTFANAGHGPAMVVINGKCSVLEAHRPPLGVGLDEPEELAEQSTVRLAVGDRVFLCSDGVSEAMDDDGEQFGNERIARIVCDRTLDAQRAVEKIRDAIRVHSGRTVMKDDVTILCVDRVSQSAAESGELLAKASDA